MQPEWDVEVTLVVAANSADEAWEKVHANLDAATESWAAGWYLGDVTIVDG